MIVSIERLKSAHELGEGECLRIQLDTHLLGDVLSSLHSGFEQSLCNMLSLNVKLVKASRRIDSIVIERLSRGPSASLLVSHAG